MRRFSERERVQIALIWACALLLFYVLVLSPLLTAERMAALAQRDSMRGQFARLDAYQHALLADARAEEKLRVRQTRLLSALPAQGRQGDFIHTVEHLAGRSGVTIEGFAPQPMQRIGELAVQPIELKFHGGYFDVLSFLRALQEGERAVQFGAFSLTAEEATELHCVVRIHIAAYVGEEKTSIE